MQFHNINIQHTKYFLKDGLTINTTYDKSVFHYKPDVSELMCRYVMLDN